MNAYIYPRATIVWPLDEPAAAAPVANAPLARRQAEALSAAGLAVLPAPDLPAAAGPGGCLLVADDLLLSPAFARRFLLAARGTIRPGRCRVRRGPFFDYFPSPVDPDVYPATDGDRLYDLYYLPPDFPLPDPRTPGALSSPGAIAAPGAPGAPLVPGAADIPVTIDIARTAPAYSHSLLAGRTIDKPLTDQYICRVAHWPDIVMGNVMYLFARRLDGEAGRVSSPSPAEARRWRREGVIVSRSVIGAGVQIDPFTAVEDSILGDGVKVGSHCRVKGSVIGAGGLICGGTHISYSVTGEAAIVNTATANFSYIGRRSHIGSLAIGDAYFDGRTVVADLGGRRIDTGLYILGFGCGHGAKIGSGLSLLPGTTIPGGVHLHDADAVGRVPANLPRGRPLYWLKGQWRDLSLKSPAGAEED